MINGSESNGRTYKRGRSAAAAPLPFVTGKAAASIKAAIGVCVMSASTTSARRNARKAAAAIVTPAIVAAAAAPVVTPAAPPPAPPAPVVVPLAQRNGADIFAALQAFAADPIGKAAAALFCAVGGSVDRATALVSIDGAAAPLAAYIGRAAEIRSVLGKAAPREFFGADFSNASGVRIGDLHASALGLSALYRADARANVKAARENALPLIVKA
jgi:hypothetical protein